MSFTPMSPVATVLNWAVEPNKHWQQCCSFALRQHRLSCFSNLQIPYSSCWCAHLKHLEQKLHIVCAATVCSQLHVVCQIAILYCKLGIGYQAEANLVDSRCDKLVCSQGCSKPCMQLVVARTLSCTTHNVWQQYAGQSSLKICSWSATLLQLEAVCLNHFRYTQSVEESKLKSADDQLFRQYMESERTWLMLITTLCIHSQGLAQRTIMLLAADLC